MSPFKFTLLNPFAFEEISIAVREFSNLGGAFAIRAVKGADNSIRSPDK